MNVRRAIAVSATLLAFAGGRGEGYAQSSEPPVAVTVDRFIGAWDLLDWRVEDGSGNVRFPYGEDAQGQVIYSADGRMSAYLMRPSEDVSDAPPQYLSYWGTYSLDADAATVTHHVIGSDQANWIGSDQVRRFTFESDGRLVLSLGSNRLTWERVR